LSARLQKDPPVKNFPLIYLITDGEITAQNFARRKSQTLEIIKVAAQNNISLIQIREKKLSARLVFELACEASEITRNTGVKLLVNDRADIALAANADGVHLTSSSLSCNSIRRNFPRDFIIGVSAHTIDEAEEAKKQGANFVTFSPIFPTPNKSEPKGIENLHEVCEKLKLFPIIALGGIDAGNFAEVLSAGASGFAAIRFLNDVENIRKLSTDKHR
jgi:thiamine-phosphate pyrophosphorylase